MGQRRDAVATPPFSSRPRRRVASASARSALSPKSTAPYRSTTASRSPSGLAPRFALLVAEEPGPSIAVAQWWCRAMTIAWAKRLACLPHRRSAMPTQWRSWAVCGRVQILGLSSHRRRPVDSVSRRSRLLEAPPHPAAPLARFTSLLNLSTAMGKWPSMHTCLVPLATACSLRPRLLLDFESTRSLWPVT